MESEKEAGIRGRRGQSEGGRESEKMKGGEAVLYRKSTAGISDHLTTTRNSPMNQKQNKVWKKARRSFTFDAVHVGKATSHSGVYLLTRLGNQK